jgi:hypothetical protein
MEFHPSRSLIGALAFAAGVVGGFVELLAEPWRVPRRSTVPHSIQRALPGSTRRQVASTLGPPPAAAMKGADGGGSTYWIADTWYYPLDPGRHMAVAVMFDGDRVVGVERIRVAP